MSNRFANIIHYIDPKTEDYITPCGRDQQDFFDNETYEMSWMNVNCGACCDADEKDYYRVDLAKRKKRK